MKLHHDRHGIWLLVCGMMFCLDQHILHNFGLYSASSWATNKNTQHYFSLVLKVVVAEKKYLMSPN